MDVKEINRDDGITHLVLAGSFDLKATNDLNQRLHALLVDRRQPAVIDMAGVDFIGSIGMGLLVACANVLNRHGKKMSMCRVQPMVDAAMRRARIHELIPFTGSLEKSLAAVKPPA